MIRRSLALFVAGIVFAVGAALATMHKQQPAYGPEITEGRFERVAYTDRAYPAVGVVLDLAEPLELSDFQRQQLRALSVRLQNETNSLRREIGTLEARLDKSFADQSIDPLRIDGLTTKIGQLEGRIRAAELMAILDSKSLLLPEQLARFGALSRAGGTSPAQPEVFFDEDN